jgi:hypothetical protein
VKTKQAILIGVYDEPVQPGEATKVVEGLADYLISVNYVILHLFYFILEGVLWMIANWMMDSKLTPPLRAVSVDFELLIHHGIDYLHVFL